MQPTKAPSPGLPKGHINTEKKNDENRTTSDNLGAQKSPSIDNGNIPETANSYWQGQGSENQDDLFGPGQGYNPFFPPVAGAGPPFPLKNGKKPPFPPPLHLYDAFHAEQLEHLSTNATVRMHYKQMNPTAELPPLKLNPQSLVSTEYTENWPTPDASRNNSRENSRSPPKKTRKLSRSPSKNTRMRSRSRSRSPPASHDSPRVTATRGHSKVSHRDSSHEATQQTAEQKYENNNNEETKTEQPTEEQQDDIQQTPPSEEQFQEEDNENAADDDDEDPPANEGDDRDYPPDATSRVVGYICHRTAPTFLSGPYIVVKTEQGIRYRIDLDKDDKRKFRVFSPVAFEYYINEEYQAFTKTGRYVNQEKIFEELQEGYNPQHLTLEDDRDQFGYPVASRCWLQGTATTARTKNNNDVLAIQVDDPDFPYKHMFVYQDNLPGKSFPAEGERLTFATSVRTTGRKGTEEWNAVTYVKHQIDRQAIHQKLHHILPPFTIDALALADNVWGINALIGEPTPAEGTGAGLPVFEPADEATLDFANSSQPLLSQMLFTMSRNANDYDRDIPAASRATAIHILRYGSTDRVPLSVLINPYNFKGIKPETWPRHIAEYYKLQDPPYPDVTFHLIHKLEYLTTEENWLHINSFNHRYSRLHMNHSHNITLFAEHVTLGRYSFTNELVFNQSETQHLLALETHKPTPGPESFNANVFYDASPPAQGNDSMAESLERMTLNNLLLVAYPLGTDSVHLRQLQPLPNFERQRPGLGFHQHGLRAPSSEALPATAAKLTGKEGFSPFLTFPANQFFTPSDNHLTIVFRNHADINLIYNLLGRVPSQPITPYEIRIDIPTNITPKELHLELQRLNHAYYKQKRTTPFIATYHKADYINWFHNCKPIPPSTHSPYNSPLPNHDDECWMNASRPGLAFIGGLNPLLSDDIVHAAAAKLGIRDLENPLRDACWVRGDAGGTLLQFTSVNPGEFLRQKPGTLGVLHPYPARPPASKTAILRFPATRIYHPDIEEEAESDQQYEPPADTQLVLHTLSRAFANSKLRPSAPAEQEEPHDNQKNEDSDEEEHEDSDALREEYQARDEEANRETPLDEDAEEEDEDEDISSQDSEVDDSEQEGKLRKAEIHKRKPPPANRTKPLIVQPEATKETTGANNRTKRAKKRAAQKARAEAKAKAAEELEGSGGAEKITVTVEEATPTPTNDGSDEGDEDRDGTGEGSNSTRSSTTGSSSSRGSSSSSSSSNSSSSGSGATTITDFFVPSTPTIPMTPPHSNKRLVHPTPTPNSKAAKQQKSPTKGHRKRLSKGQQNTNPPP